MSVVFKARLFFRWLGLGLLTVLLLIVLVVATNWGNRLLISALGTLTSDKLKVELRQGSLFNEPQLENIEFKFATGVVTLEQLSLSWDWQCIIDSGFCLTAITLNDLNLNLTTTSSETAKPSAPLTTIELPFWLRLEQLAVNDVELKIDHNIISWQQLQLVAQFKDSTFTLDDFTLAGLRVTLADKGPAQANAKASDGPIELPKIELPVVIVINNLSLIDSELALANNIQRLEKLSLSLQAAGSDIEISHLKLDHQLARIKLAGNISLKQQYPLNITSEIVTRPALELGENTLAINLSGSLNQLVSSLEIAGEFNAELAAQVNLLAADLPFELSANWTKFKLPSQAINIAKGQLTSQGSLSQFDYSLQAGVSGVQIPQSSFELMGQGSINDLTIERLTINTLNGEVAAQGQLDWQDGLTWQSQLTLDHLDPAQHWPQLTGLLNGKLSSSGQVKNQQWQVNLNQLDLDGRWLEQPLKLSGQVSGKSAANAPFGQWDIAQVELNNGINQLLIDGKVASDIALDVMVDFQNLAQSIPDVSGQITGRLALKGDTNSPSLMLDLTAQQLNIPVAQLAIAKLVAQGSLTTNLTAPNDLLVELSDIKIAEQHIAQLKLDFAGSWRQHLAKLTLVGQPVAAAIQLSGQYQDNQWQGSLHDTLFDTPAGRWHNREPVALRYNLTQQRLALGPHCWLQQSSSASLCVTETANVGAMGDIAIALNQFNLSSLNSLLQQSDTKLDGQIDIIANARWQPDSAPTVAATINSLNGQVAVIANDKDFINHYKNLIATFSLKQQQASVKLAVESPQLGQLSLLASNNIFVADSPLSGQLELSDFNLAALKNLLPQLDLLSGEIKASTTIAGTLKAPLFHGEIKVSNGNITGLTLPAQVEQFNATIALNGDWAEIDSDFKLGQGPAKIAGQLHWLPTLSANLTIDGDKLTVNPTTDVGLTFSPAMTIAYVGSQVDGDSLAVGGQLTVDQGLIEINELPESAVSLSDDVVIIDSQSTDQQPLANKLALLLDLKVIIKEQLKVDAFGLTAALAGQLSLAQAKNTPLTGHGELNLIDAKYIAMGQNLDIRRGKMLFNGALAQPFVNIEAVRTADLSEDCAISGVNVTGSAKQPQLEVFSEPAMSQQEALYCLMLGRKTLSDDTGSNENMMLGMLLSSGLGRTGNLVNNIGDSLGISDMSLNTTGSGDDTAVEVSGYVADGVEIRYAVGVFDSQPQLTIRYQLLPQLFVDIIKGSDEALDLLYKFDFD